MRILTFILLVLFTCSCKSSRVATSSIEALSFAASEVIAESSAKEVLSIHTVWNESGETEEYITETVFSNPDTIGRTHIVRVTETKRIIQRTINTETDTEKSSEAFQTEKSEFQAQSTTEVATFEKKDKKTGRCMWVFGVFIAVIVIVIFLRK